MALFKLLKVDLCFQLEKLSDKMLFFPNLTQSSSKLSLRETLIGLIMFAVIKHLNGTHHNMRHESQWCRDVTFGLWKTFLSGTNNFFYFFNTLHTHTVAGNLKRDTYRLWSLGGQGRVRAEQRHWESGERDLTALHSHPATRGRDRRGSLTWKRRIGGRRGSLECVKRKLQAPVSQAAERQREEGDKSRENSKTPAVSSSSSSSLSLL